MVRQSALRTEVSELYQKLTCITLVLVVSKTVFLMKTFKNVLNLKMIKRNGFLQEWIMEKIVFRIYYSQTSQYFEMVSRGTVLRGLTVFAMSCFYVEC